ncbi:MAG: hypothetical protein IPJ65_19485 [Archangiaceae bacterium]|nr:hypothetical protein [Archangiaceae bacterium]
MSGHVLFDLALLPRWEVISEVRRLVSRALERLEIEPDHAYCASLATHELLENAVKYGKGEVRVRIVLDPKERTVKRVDVENWTTRAQVQRLKRAVGDVATAQNAMRKYTSLMGRSNGGLGLARVAAEGEMSLLCRVRANRVAVSAVPTGGSADV